MPAKSIQEKKFQASNFANYKSLDFQNKIYQIKAFDFAKKYLRPGQKVLELGCADGSFVKFLSQKTKTNPYGLDISSQSIKLAKKSGVNAKNHDLSNRLPFGGNKFDLIISLETIEHLYDTDFLIEEMKRVVKRKGFIIISTPNLASLNNRFRLFSGKYPKYLDYNGKIGGHIHLYTPGILKSQLNEHGLKIVAYTSPNFFNPFITKKNFPKILKKVSMKFGDIFPTIGSHLIFVVKKN